MGTLGGGARLNRKNSSLMFRDITPPHEWKEDSDFYYLCLTIPGFDNKEVTIHVDKYGHLVIRGNKQVSEHKCISFEETYDLPKNSDIEEASGQFDNEQIYCVYIPKQRGVTPSTSTGHAISVPKEETKNSSNGEKEPPVEIYPNNRNENKKVPQELPKLSGSNSLKLIARESTSKKQIIVFSVTTVLLIVFLVIAVALIVKFHH